MVEGGLVVVRESECREGAVLCVWVRRCGCRGGGEGGCVESRGARRGASEIG